MPGEAAVSGRYTVIHVKVPKEWHAGLKALADESEGTINQQTRLAIRERLERKGLLAKRQDGRQTELANQEKK